MSDNPFLGRECRHCDSSLPLEPVGLRLVCACCSRAADDLPAEPGRVEPAAAGPASRDTASSAPAGRQAHDAPPAAPDGPRRANDSSPDGEPALDVAAVLAALKRDDRDPASGRFRPGHLRNLKHGRRAPSLWAAGPLAEALAERVEALVGDYGGRENLTTAEHALVVELGRLQLLTEAAGENLVREGLATSKGRMRAGCSLWLGLLDRQSRLAGQLGLQRRARPAQAAIAEWAAAQVARDGEPQS